ncbi:MULTISPECIES: YrzI family small protein [unclassified Peribacillus]|nr:MULTISPECIES: YrzI family small protein [unclassified Peribacillus]MBK5442641.1 YrzI family small protein [Peribacillus sp. TH24]MBK5462613.1 YrzI family small protein [Peribacillus sp. TH27]MBK5484049.1 YrzI family small protein [Peribacillus sp. TH16]MBK5500766.1 YrzI family small protein [Peribacillus sp. TH14]WMX54218.1 YrzI family small protein [Peribacillus sp. R9-11]
MTLNMLFFTITIKMKKMTAEECLQQERINKLREEHLNNAMKHRPFF